MTAPRHNPRLLTRDEISRRVALVLKTRQPCLHTLEKMTGIDKSDLKRYVTHWCPEYERRLILSDFFRKIDLGIYELYQRPYKKGKGTVWDIRMAAEPRPPVSACVTFGPAGPKLRFKSTAELLGYETWRPPEKSEHPSNRPTGFLKNTVV